MRKVFISLLLVALMILSAGAFAYAEDYEGPEGLEVVYDGEELTSNLDLPDLLDELQPGDSLTIRVSLVSDAEGDTDWWMANSVIDSFETSARNSGGAYTYNLSYNGETIYSNESLGGDETAHGVGLLKADKSIADFFFLDTLSQGDTGEVVLVVSLDGETQGNIYQDTDAELDLTFGVEPAGVEPVEPKPPVKTGDTTVITPYIVTGVIGLILLLGVLIFGRKKAKEQ